MQLRRGFQFELMPDGRQTRLMREFCGCCRYVYNRTLATEKSLYARDESHHFSYANATSRLVEWKRKHPFLKACHSQILQQALKDLDRAYQNFFAQRAHFPKFRKKFQNDSFRFPQGFKLDEKNARIYLPKIGWVRYRKSRFIEGKIKNVTVSRSVDKWLVSVQTEYEQDCLCMINSKIGIDMGVKRFLTLSDGTYLEPLNPLKVALNRLAVLQRKSARQKHTSQNAKKTKIKIAKLHHHIACIRRDFLHKSSAWIAKNHGIVYVENLKIKHMSASASGTIQSPGSNVKQKSGLNRSILDQGWYSFFQMLEYKLQERGGMLVKVDPKNTSRTCPNCGHVSAENRKTQANFVCVKCGFRENADKVGAINILRAGQARLACEMCGDTPPSGTKKSLSAGTL